MILPVGAKNFEEAMQMGSETYHHLKVAFILTICAADIT
jgi:enolase